MRNLRGYFTAGIFAGLTLLLVSLADKYGAVLFSIYPFMSRTAMDFMAETTANFPGCLWQTLILVFGVILVASIGVMIFTKYNFFRWLGWVLAVVSIVAFLWVGVCGLNYYGPPLSDSLLMDVDEYSKEELIEAAEYYQAEANRLADRVARDGGDPKIKDFETLANKAPEGFKTLTKRFSVFGGTQLPVKKLGWAGMYREMGISGITIGLTGEAAVDPEDFSLNLPYHMCHEMAHRKTIAREEDANFAAFLACDANTDVQFRYSGYFNAYLYCRNALNAADPAAAAKLREKENDNLAHDLKAYSDYCAQFAGKKQEKATQVNDVFLKTMGQENGVGSYGDVVDLLVNWYLSNWDPDLEVEEEPLFDPYHPEDFAPEETTAPTEAEEDSAA